MVFRQNSSKVVISSVVSEVSPVWEVSSRRRCQATWMARLVGTLVKKETTSKKIGVSASRVCKDMNAANLWSCVHCDWCYQLVGLRSLKVVWTIGMWGRIQRRLYA